MNSPVSTDPDCSPAADDSPRATHRDPAFPSLHIRPERGWLNDPNGVSYVDGTYHVFFQYNPFSARHHAIRWGHASSTDLVTWHDEPVALAPRPGHADSFGCWSGAVTIDDGVPTAVYSGIDDPDDHGRSHVMLARSDRALRDWVQEADPVAGLPEGAGLIDMRDPFILEVDGHRWALQGAGLADGRAAVVAHSCDDLHAWDYRGIVLASDHPVAAAHAPATVWECPQLVVVDGTWVLIVSPLVGETRPLAFDRVAWLAGDLRTRDGALIFDPVTGGRLDVGPDFYAPQALVMPDRVLLWGWTWENGRTPEEADAAGWAGALTFPRELNLRDGVLVQTPARELASLRTGELHRGAIPEGGVVVDARAFEVLVDAGASSTPIGAPGGVAEARVRLWLEPDDVPAGAAGRASRPTAAVPSAAWRGVRIFVDGSVVEVFVEGEPTRTLREYPVAGQRWRIDADGGVEVTVWGLGLPRR